MRTDSFGGILIDEPTPSPRPPVTDSFGGVLIDDWPPSPAPYQQSLQPPYATAPSPGMPPDSRHFTPEQYQAFARLSGLGPAMAAGSLPLDIAATDSAKIDHAGGPGYFVMPASYGRLPQEGEPLAPVIAPEDLPQPPGPPSAVVTVPKPPGPPSAIVTVPRSTGRPSAVITVPKPTGPPSAIVTVPRSTGRPSAVVTVPQSTGRPSAVITVPKDLGEPPGSAGESASSHGGGFLRAVGNSGNSVMRGAVSDGYQQIAEGFYNMLGSMLGRNPHSNTPTPDLRIHLRIAEQKLAVEQAAMDARRKREPRSRGFAPPPDYGKLKDQIRSIQDELNYRQGDGESFSHALRSFIESTQDEAARHRQASRDLFKVDDDFANSPAGAVFSTIGGLTTLPLNATPLGIPTTIAQTYQGGYDDYVQARERQGLPVNRDEAERAAATYLATSGPVQVALDKIPLGKLLKPLAGKATVGQVLSRLAPAIQGGVSNAADQLLLNTSAKILQGYDRERTFDDGVLQNVLMGSAIGHLGGLGQHPSAPVGNHVNFDPETINPNNKPYYVVTPSSKKPPSSAVAGGTPNLESGRFNERESDVPKWLKREEKGQGRKALEAELKRIKPMLAKHGVKLREGNENRSIIENDKIILKYSPDVISGREFIVTREEKGKWREHWGEASRFAIGEELIHVAHLLAIRKEWSAKGGKPGTFEAYFNAENRKVFLDMKDAIKSANGETRKHLEQTLLDCFNLYYGNSKKQEPRAADINEVFTLLEHEQWSIHFTVEFLRQVTQLKRQGKVNEEILATFDSKIGAWVRQAIERIKAFLPRTDKSEFGLEAHLALKKIESELDLIENSP